MIINNFLKVLVLKFVALEWWGALNVPWQDFDITFDDSGCFDFSIMYWIHDSLEKEIDLNDNQFYLQ